MIKYKNIMTRHDQCLTWHYWSVLISVMCTRYDIVIFSVLLFTKQVYRGLEFLCPCMELHNFIFSYDVSLLLIVRRDIFSLWCFPCLYLRSAFMGWSCPGFYEVFSNQVSILSSGWSFLHLFICRVLATTTGGLSAPDWSCTSLVYSSLVSHSVSLSKFGDIDCGDPALIRAYSTICSTGKGGVVFGPTSATDGQGQKFPRSLADHDSTSVSNEGTPLIAIHPAPFVWGS